MISVSPSTNKYVLIFFVKCQCDIKYPQMSMIEIVVMLGKGGIVAIEAYGLIIYFG